MNNLYHLIAQHLHEKDYVNFILSSKCIYENCKESGLHEEKLKEYNYLGIKFAIRNSDEDHRKITWRSALKLFRYKEMYLGLDPDKITFLNTDGNYTELSEFRSIWIFDIYLIKKQDNYWRLYELHDDKFIPLDLPNDVMWYTTFDALFKLIKIMKWKYYKNYFMDTYYDIVWKEK